MDTYTSHSGEYVHSLIKCISSNTARAFADKDEYTSKVAHSVEEACELIDKGFEYVGCINGAEIFRTRK